MDEQNRIKSPEVNLYIYGLFNKGPKMPLEKGESFQQLLLGLLDVHMPKKKKIS